jgi:hypothetical protein
MDEFMRRASEYFREFEGRHLYPRLLSWYWLLWLVTAIVFGRFAFLDFAPSHRNAGGYTKVFMFASEVAFLAVCAPIAAHKTRKLLADGPSKRGSRGLYLDARKREALERVCGVDSSKFAGLAKECCDLLAAKRQFRSVADLSWSDVLRNFYDPDSKARILALMLSAAALFVALLNHSVPAEDFNILDAVDDASFGATFRQFMSLSIEGFGLYIGLRVMAGWLVELANSAWAVVFGGTAGSQMALNYFVRDLIRLHISARASEPPNKPGTQAPEDQLLLFSAPERDLKHNDSEQRELEDIAA